MRVWRDDETDLPHFDKHEFDVAKYAFFNVSKNYLVFNSYTQNTDAMYEAVINRFTHF